MTRLFLEDTPTRRIFDLTYLLEKHGGMVVIGRKGGKPDICLGDGDSKSIVLKHNLRTVSREHAILTLDRHKDIYLQDYNSRRGTKVNGKQITEATRLRGGDRIYFGIYGALPISEEI